jgi:hypothetical protein
MNEPQKVIEKEMPEYKRIQRECRKLARRIFVPRSDLKTGDILTGMGGEKYRIGADGSWRRI